jgi:hypothetical protein
MNANMEPLAGAARGKEGGPAPEGARIADGGLPKIKVNVEFTEGGGPRVDELADVVVDTISHLVRKLGFEVDDSDLCETSANTYTSGIGFQWTAVDVCLGTVGGIHLHVDMTKGWTPLRTTVEAEAYWAKQEREE